MLAVIPLVLSLTSRARAVPVQSTVVQSYDGWSTVGCFVDSIQNRQLPHGEATPGGTAAMTVEICLDACKADGYSVAGLEWSQECYCGNAIPPHEATDGRCNMVCNGNANEICGGADGLTVYQLAASVVPSYKTWTYIDCFEDSIADRTIPHAQSVSGPMTVEACLDSCRADGYTVAGLEYSHECYCGNALPPQVATDGRCSMSCEGKPGQICGGGNGLTVYQTPPSSPPKPLPSYKSWTYQNCYVDSVLERVLPQSQQVQGPMTIEKCLDACDSAGYEYGGVEYGQECYCGRTSPAQIATDGRCSMPCQGNDAEACGGGNGIDVYHSCSASNSPHDIAYYNGWTFQGCFVDSIHSRVLPIQAAEQEGPSMTIEKCLDACHAIGYDYAGVEYSSECFCGSSMPNEPANDGRCSMVCHGNEMEYCGGGNGIDVYSYVGGAPGLTIGGSNNCAPPSTTFTTHYVSTTAVETTFTFTTTIIEPTTGVTTVAVPVVGTATIPQTITVPTTVAATETELTTVTVPVTASRTIVSAVPVTTTIPVPVTATSTIAVPFTASTTVLQPLTTVTNLAIPTTASVTTTVGATVTIAPTVTTTRTSYTLGIYTGTTSFVDPLTTIYQPVIILTTLARTITYTTTGPATGVPTSVGTVRPVTTTIVTPSGVTQTIGDVRPVTGTSFIYTPVTTTSFNIQPTVISTTEIEAFSTDTAFVSSYTETVPVATEIAVPTDTLSEYTTTSFATDPALGTFVTTSTTTVITTFPQTYTGTTTVTTAVATATQS